MHAGFCQLADESRDADYGAAEGRESQDLRADMGADSLPGNMVGARLVEVEISRVVPVNAEFVAVMAGGDVGVAAGLDVGIDAEGGGGFAFEERGFGGQGVEFGFGFDVEEEDVRAECFAD